jgi:hypothetical protein
MNLFGKRKPTTSAPSSGGGAPTKDAITRLREAEDQLTKREEHLMRKADHELAEAKKFAAEKNKRCRPGGSPGPRKRHSRASHPCTPLAHSDAVCRVRCLSPRMAAQPR